MNFDLSICIPTLNRATFIGETLDSIVSQIDERTEVVIVDGGSRDGTREIVESYQAKFPQIRYCLSPLSTSGPSNSGFDQDCNLAVELSQGKYCWLMTDDDLLLPGAVREVLEAIKLPYALIIVSVEIKNVDLTRTFTACRPDLDADRSFAPEEWQSFTELTARHLTFVGALIIDRQLWLSRDRAKYFGTGFVHLGVIFDQPVDRASLVIAKPLVTIRLGNAQWSSRAFQIWMFGWPKLMWSFESLSREVKQKITPEKPWDNLKTLAVGRAFGTYSFNEYQLFLRDKFDNRMRQHLARLIALTPRLLFVLAAYLYAKTQPSKQEMMLFELKQSLIQK